MELVVTSPKSESIHACYLYNFIQIDYTHIKTAKDIKQDVTSQNTDKRKRVKNNLKICQSKQRTEESTYTSPTTHPQSTFTHSVSSHIKQNKYLKKLKEDLINNR